MNHNRQKILVKVHKVISGELQKIILHIYWQMKENSIKESLELTLKVLLFFGSRLKQLNTEGPLHGENS